MGSSRTRNSNSATRARSVQKSSKRRSKPTKLRKDADALRAIKHARGPGAAEPATALRDIRKKLELIQSTVIVVAYALKEQNVEMDDDAADVLRRHVSDELQEQIEGIDSLLGEVPS